MPYKPTGRPPGRPRKVVPPLVLERLESGEAATIAEAVEGLDIGRSTAARHLAGDAPPVAARPASRPATPAPSVELAPVAAGPGVAKAAAPPAEPAAPAIVAGTPLERLRVYAAHDAQALLVLERMAAPAPLSTDPQIHVQRLLASLEADYRDALPGKRGAFAEKMISALKELRQYFPPTKPAPPADLVLAAVQAQDAGCIAKLEEHLTESERATVADLAAPTNGATS